MTTMTEAPRAVATRWQVDPSHTEVEFGVRHLMISTVKGRFGKVSGTVAVDPATPGEARVDVTIDITSIDTREEKRDAHLRSPDFFDADHFPTMTFHGGKLAGDLDGDFTLSGDLTIRGVTRPVTLDVTFEGAVTDPWGGKRRGYSARGKLNRQDFGLTWNAALEAGGVVVGDEVKLTIATELVLQA